MIWLGCKKWSWSNPLQHFQMVRRMIFGVVGVRVNKFVNSKNFWIILQKHFLSSCIHFIDLSQMSSDWCMEYSQVCLQRASSCFWIGLYGCPQFFIVEWQRVTRIILVIQITRSEFLEPKINGLFWLQPASNIHVGALAWPGIWNHAEEWHENHLCFDTL